MSKNFLHDKVYPAIYSEYSRVLKAIYSVNKIKTDTQKQLYLQELQGPARELWDSYRPEGSSYVEVDYTTSGFQEVYLLRYFFPHSLFVPSILDFLSRKDAHEIKDTYGLRDTSSPTSYSRADLLRILEDPHNNESFPNHRKAYEHFFRIISDMFGHRSINASFFGCGPCPELCGFRKYLELNTARSQVEISASMLDIKPWKFKYSETPHQFQTDLAGNLNVDSENCVQASDLITIQCCLNEVPSSKHEQLLKNLAHIVDSMKSEALLLIIERSGYVNQLFRNLSTELTGKFNNIQMIFHSWRLDQTDFNDFNRDVPQDLENYLFVQTPDKGTWLSNKIEYGWLAVSKQ